MSKQVSGFNYQSGKQFTFSSKDAKSLKNQIMDTGARRIVINGDETLIAKDGSMILEFWSKQCLCSTEQKAKCVAQCGVKS
jgi:hypothetical protein